MKLKITVHGVAYEVDVEVLEPGDGFAPGGPLPPVQKPAPSASTPPSGAPPREAPARSPSGSGSAASSRAVASPIAGTVVEVKCQPGQAVDQGQVLLVVEAMKMNTSIAAPAAGTIKTVHAAAGDTVREGQVLVDFE